MMRISYRRAHALQPLGRDDVPTPRRGVGPLTIVPVGTADERLERHDGGDTGHQLDVAMQGALFKICCAALAGLAKHDNFESVGDVHQLRDITDAAYYFAKTVADYDEAVGIGHRIGASVAVSLIRRGPEVFRSGELPASREWWAGTDYLANVGVSVAWDATELWPFDRIQLLPNPVVHTALVTTLTQLSVDRGGMSPVAATHNVATILAAYNRPDDLRFLRRILDELADAGAPIVEPPVDNTNNGSRWKRGVASLGMAVAVLVLVLAVLAIGIKIGGQQSTDTADPSTLSVPAAAPTIPVTPGQVDMFRQLPNTDVELFVVNGDVAPLASLRTMAGSIPDAGVVVVPFEGVIEFELWVTVRPESSSGDLLKVAVRTADPTVITAASDRRLVDKQAVEVDLRSDPDHGFRFQVTAAADDSGNVGYWCGYNAMPVEVLVSATENLQTAAITTYPLYVLYAPENC